MTPMELFEVWDMAMEESGEMSARERRAAKRRLENLKKRYPD